MKTYPNLYTTDRVVDSLSLLKEQQTKEKQEILQSLMQHITIFNQCRTAWGERISTHMECEYIKKDTCEGILWWTYTACASACRHMSDAICTLECIPLCSLAI
jgi:hypothetical protein